MAESWQRSRLSKKRWSIMHHYRIYKMAGDKRIPGPPQVFTCSDDEEAVSKVKQVLDGQDIEVWQGAHLVSRLQTSAA